MSQFEQLHREFEQSILDVLCSEWGRMTLEEIAELNTVALRAFSEPASH